MLFQNYAPFFREGRLFLPETTINLLVESGLDVQVAQLAKHGLELDDRRNIGLISIQLEKALEGLSKQSPIHDQLSSQETKFMLSDIDKELSAAV